MNFGCVYESGRRAFLKMAGAVGAGFVLGRAGRLCAEETGPVPRRKFGRHDETVASLALGGWTLRTAADEEAQRIVGEAIDLGVTFFDNAWDYHKGEAEALMGRCLEGKRDKVFLMSKVCTHDTGGKPEAMKMLEEFLARLRTDRLDLWLVHAVATRAQVERAFGPGGVIEALDEARRQGKVRFVGFSGHTDPDVLLDMLSRKYPFDAVLLPISAIEANSNAFVRRVLPELVSQGIAPLGMKSLGGGGQPVRHNVITAEEGIRYALSHPLASLVSGIGSAAHLRENARVAATMEKMTREQMVALEERVKAASESGKYEPYRNWLSYRDGDAHLAARLA